MIPYSELRHGQEIAMDLEFQLHSAGAVEIGYIDISTWWGIYEPHYLRDGHGTMINVTKYHYSLCTGL